VATDPSGNVRTSTYEVSQAGAPKTFTYDLNGNMTSDGTRSYEWDAENRLVAVNEGATTIASYTYNATGLRTSKTVGGVTSSYVLDGLDAVEERLSTGDVTKHLHGPGLDNVLATQDGAGLATYVTHDHLGSVREHVDSLGTLTLRREYDPWGRILAGGSVGGWAFAGGEHDLETELQYYRSRYYDPRLGRFWSQDPIGSEKGLSKYRYARANPVAFRDALGLASEQAAPQFLIPSQADQYLDVLSNGYGEALRRVNRKKCKEFFCSKGEETLGATKYYFGELPQGPKVAAQVPSTTLVQINTKGLYMTATSGTITLPTRESFNLGTVTNVRAFILLHELGHQLKCCTDFTDDVDDATNAKHSKKILKNCF
jgi:RHS repeat-associated protein